jgi:hypothetical protein
MYRISEVLNSEASARMATLGKFLLWSTERKNTLAHCLLKNKPHGFMTKLPSNTRVTRLRPTTPTLRVRSYKFSRCLHYYEEINELIRESLLLYSLCIRM